MKQAFSKPGSRPKISIELKHLHNPNKCTNLQYLSTLFYKAPTCFGLVIPLPSGSWHQYFFETQQQ